MSFEFGLEFVLLLLGYISDRKFSEMIQKSSNSVAIPNMAKMCSWNFEALILVVKGKSFFLYWYSFLLRCVREVNISCILFSISFRWFTCWNNPRKHSVIISVSGMLYNINVVLFVSTTVRSRNRFQLDKLRYKTTNKTNRLGVLLYPLHQARCVLFQKWLTFTWENQQPK